MILHGTVCLNGVMSYVKWLPGGAKSKNRMWYQLQMSSCITLLHLFLNFRRWIYYCFWYLWSSIFSLSLLFKTKLYALKFCNSRKNIFGIEYFRTKKKAELFVFWNGYTVASYSNENLTLKWELPTCPHPLFTAPLFSVEGKRHNG